MVQDQRELIALAQLIPSAYVRKLKRPETPDPGNLITSSGLCRPHIHVHMHKYIHMCNTNEQAACHPSCPASLHMK